MTNYEEFLRAFHGTEEQQYDAGLLLTMRDWLIRMDKSLEREDGTQSLDAALSGEPYLSSVRPEEKQDTVSRILEESFQAFRTISVQMREVIVRENVKLPVYKVREMNRYGMMWLSRRPGRTVREKASGSNTIMAVARRMTLDTGENRLFLEYLRQLSGVLQDKLQALPPSGRSAREEDMLRQIQLFLRNDALEEIRPWGNLPPNNTLLSDQNYRKIWNGWSGLQQIDDLAEQDSAHLPERMSTLFFVELLKALKRLGRVPQLPLLLDYTGFRVEICGPEDAVPVLTPDGRVFRVRCEGNRTAILFPDRKMTVAFTRDAIQFDSERDSVTYPLTESRMETCIQDVLYEAFGEEEGRGTPAPAVLRQREAIVDLFALYPLCYVPGRGAARLEGRLLYQDIVSGGETVELPCDRAQAVYLTAEPACYTVRSSLENGDLHRLGRLTHLLERYLEANTLAFLYPDIYTSLQVSLLYKAARMAYPEVRSLPRSIGAAFFWQESEAFGKTFHEGDFLLSVDLVGDDLTCTLVRGTVDEKAGELVWERHPTVSIPLDAPIREGLRQLERGGCAESEQLFAVFGFEGMACEAGRLAFFSAESDSGWESFTIPEKPFQGRELQIDVTRQISGFLNSQRSLTGRGKVHVQIFSPFLAAAGPWPRVNADADDALYGCALCRALQAKTETPLWCDYLPRLAIKLLHGEFPLIAEARVAAQYGQRVRIPVDNIFTLSAGRPCYQFDLIQSETSKSTSFIAEVRSSAFPLKTDVPCSLELWYQYGSENPFTLTFRPCQESNAPFRQALVSWLPRSQAPYPVDDLPLPEFPAASGWHELAHFWGKRQEEIDIPAEIAQHLNLLAQPYYTVDLRQKQVKITGAEGKRHFTIPCTIDGKTLPVFFLESKIDSGEKPAPLSFSEMKTVYFNIEKQKMQRFTLRLTPGRYGEIWSPSDKGGYYHYENDFPYNGQLVTVAFFSSEFFQMFDKSVCQVSFGLATYGQNRLGVPRYKAIQISDIRHDEGLDTSYAAAFIRRRGMPPSRVVSNFYLFLFHTMYFGRNSIFDPDCPEVLKEAFCRTRDRWASVYQQCGSESVRLRLFNLMSLAAGDLGDAYYQIANQQIAAHMEDNTRPLSVYIGYALLDYTKEREIQLWKCLRCLPDRDIVYILSKAVWGTPDFILHFPAESILQYFDAAVKYVGVDITRWEKKELKRAEAENNLRMCFEYALGVFRMRQLPDSRIRWNLSMNSATVQKLYGWVERAIDDGIQVHTFLKLTIANKRQYESVPDLLYALLIYLTGREEDESIKISGIDFDGAG